MVFGKNDLDRQQKHTTFRRGALAVMLFAPLLVAANVNHWQPPFNSTGLLQLDHGKPLPAGSYSANFWLDYAYRTLVYRFPDGSYNPVINHQLGLDASLSYSITNRIDVAVGVPLLLRQWGAAPPTTVEGFADPSGTGLGDMRLSGRVLLLPASVWNGDFAFKLDLFLPTGDTGMQAGTGTLSLRPGLLASYPLVPRLTVFAGLAYLWQRNQSLYTTPYGDTIEAHVGGRLALTPDYDAWHVMAEWVGRTSSGHLFGTNLTAMETFLGVGNRYDRHWDVVLAAAFGTGRQVGNPLVRVLLGVSYRPDAPDRDGDGIPDAWDACPDEPETINGIADDDGCPEKTALPRPPPPDFQDRDGDGIPDAQDMCPDIAEDLDGFADDDGCPEADNDNDGIPDAQDRCPNASEDRDGFADDDGCPDLDNDKDGIPDTRDKCPDEPETINGVDDKDGCPDSGEAAVAYTPDKGIMLLKVVQFETGKANLLKTSNTILDQVAAQLLAHPEVSLVRVEGHTDNVGKPALNLRLSQARAETVRLYLIKHGIAKERLVAQGYGMTQPIADNQTAAGRATNRRVAFTILQSKASP